MTEVNLRKEILAKCRSMNASGLNCGVSGKNSARFGEKMLIMPPDVDYEMMTPEMVAAMPLEHEVGEMFEKIANYGRQDSP